MIATYSVVVSIKILFEVSRLQSLNNVHALV